VGVLWITGGLMWEIPHCEPTPAFFVMNIGSREQILTIFENQLARKLVTANIKIFLKRGKPCGSKGTLDKRKIKELGELAQIGLSLRA
jgi:hypothetical protein